MIEDDFNGDKINFLEKSQLNNLGFSKLSLNGGVGDAGPTGLVGNGFLRGEVDGKGSDRLSLNFSFASVYGFAFEGLQNNSTYSPKNLDLRDIVISVSSQQWVLSELYKQDKSDIPFLGFVSSEILNGFSLLSTYETKPGYTREGENFYLDQLVFAKQLSVVSEPSALALILLGVFGLRLRGNA